MGGQSQASISTKQLLCYIYNQRSHPAEDALIRAALHNATSGKDNWLQMMKEFVDILMHQKEQNGYANAEEHFAALEAQEKQLQLQTLNL